MQCDMGHKMREVCDEISGTRLLGQSISFDNYVLSVNFHLLFRKALLEAAGFTPIIKPDARIEGVSRKLEKLSGMVETLRNHFIDYAAAVRAMTEAGILIAQDTQQFYQLSPGRRLVLEYVVVIFHDFFASANFSDLIWS